MNALMDWLDSRHHRLILLFGIFTLSAWWILKNQIQFALPLTSITTITELTVMTTVKDATVLTRWVATYLDHGINIPMFFSSIHLEDWTFLILGFLLSLKGENKGVTWIARIVLIGELLLNAVLIVVLSSALKSLDTLFILQSIRLFAQAQLVISVGFMFLLFLGFLKLCFIEYRD